METYPVSGVGQVDSLVQKTPDLAISGLMQYIVKGASVAPLHLGVPHTLGKRYITIVEASYGRDVACNVSTKVRLS